MNVLQRIIAESIQTAMIGTFSGWANRIGPTNEEQNIWARVPDDALRNDTRLFFKTYASMCLYEYAVTYDGARKMLSSMSEMCRYESQDPDINVNAKSDWHKGYTFDIPFSAMINILRLVDGANSRLVAVIRCGNPGSHI
ncbi:uncharacterized protein A1O5_06657 [Cladophialophora psammophila CBS 110553]|uniref:Uncharacterized protein n=1 Tax=Cladophialophora psammophila CBS 110553 TaxID=1182543 RepID=W9WQV2_9EURO|nr:uncharacterized protein A1O5_06657 [Cladophialophora psammophila CBS 110553]EXJ70587.1 hypothetical protein A1O5_06657 [Cladophialophora psammophila CBS 110553]